MMTDYDVYKHTHTAINFHGEMYFYFNLANRKKKKHEEKTSFEIYFVTK